MIIYEIMTLILYQWHVYALKKKQRLFKTLTREDALVSLEVFIRSSPEESTLTCVSGSAPLASASEKEGDQGRFSWTRPIRRI